MKKKLEYYDPFRKMVSNRIIEKKLNLKKDDECYRPLREMIKKLPIYELHGCNLILKENKNED